MDIAFSVQQKIGFRYVLDQLMVSSPYGQEQKRDIARCLPKDRAALEQELQSLNRAVLVMRRDKPACDAFSRQLMGLKDIRRSIAALAEKSTSDVELFEIKRYLLQLQQIQPLYDALSEGVPFGGRTVAALPDALAVLDTERTGTPTFRISDRMSAALAAIRKEKRAVEQDIRSASGAEKERLLVLRTGIVAREEQEEAEVRLRICGQLTPYVETMLQNCTALGYLDLLFSKAELAVRYEAVMPELTYDTLDVTEMRNPMLCDRLAERGRAFTPLSVLLTAGSTVITGANMGGKSVALYSLLLNVLCAACGLFVFCKKARLPLFDTVSLVAEDAEDAMRGLSSFGAELLLLDASVRQADGEGFSLLLFDELARGTNPDEGARIVLGTVRYLDRDDCMAVFATHYDGVAAAARKQYRVMGLRHLDMGSVSRELSAASVDRVAVIERHMDYGLYAAEGKTAVSRDALHVCELLDLSGPLLTRIRGEYERQKM